MLVKLVVRGRVELPTFRFSGEIWPSRAAAGRRLISHLTCTIVAGRRQASLGVCLRWLPLWLPLWLPVWLPFDSLNREAESHRRRVIGLHLSSPADSVTDRCSISLPQSGPRAVLVHVHGSGVWGNRYWCD